MLREIGDIEPNYRSEQSRNKSLSAGSVHKSRHTVLATVVKAELKENCTGKVSLAHAHRVHLQTGHGGDSNKSLRNKLVKSN